MRNATNASCGLGRCLSKLGIATVLLSVAGAAVGASPGSAMPMPPMLSAADASTDDRGLAFIKSHIFGMLTPEQQKIIAASGEYAIAPTREIANPEFTLPMADEIKNLPRLDDRYDEVRRVTSRATWESMKSVHQHAIMSILEGQAEGRPVPLFCFGPGTDPTLQDAFNAAQFGRFGERFRIAARWPQTATNASTGGQGDRITLTYSFVPDGTTVPTLTSGVTQPSNLFAFLNGIYGGNTATWQALYAQIFARWGELIGVTYVFEPNDDGTAFGTAGQLGVRGDCRMAGTALDGNSGVLAFNYFPSVGIGGDMVIDTNDNFYSTTTTNSLRLRNVLAHEHGHGLGMAHVCPTNQTKLMEPFISVAYDGPQIDDIANGQRNYGDPLEPNDLSTQPTAITNADATVRTITNISIDDDADVDFHRFTLSGTGILRVTARPLGGTYLEGPQNANGSCTPGTNYAASSVHNLRVQILNSALAVIADFNEISPGGNEISEAVISAGGTYFARVSGDSTDGIQMYELQYTYRPGPGVIVSFPTGTPSTLVPSGPGTNFDVRIQTLADVVAPANARLFYNYGASTGNAFVSVPLTPLGGENYRATLPPAPCGSSPLFYVQATGNSGAVGAQPFAGAAGPKSATVGTINTVFSDDFEIDRGWTFGLAGDTAIGATQGQWTRADPVGTAAQPENAVSPVNCAFTGQGAVGGAVGTNDVDVGFTTLLSPVLNLVGRTNVRFEYQRWFNNNAGANPNSKTFRVDYSTDDGVTWVNGETIGPGGVGAIGGWILGGFNLPGTVTPTSTMRVRFVADDTGTGSVYEAAVDDFRVTSFVCSNPCLPDVDNSGALSVDDIFVFLNFWFAGDPRANFDANPAITIDDIFVFLNLWFAGC